MGFFDRFKKKKEEPKVEQQKQPLTLQYSDGTVANITFDGACEVDGKSLHTAHVEYIAPDGSFTSRSLLLEPITSQGANGEVIDSTEQYYKWMADRDGTKEASARYSAVKGFFKQQEITEQKLGSNYIGNIAQREDGQYFRHYDNNFRQRYDVIAKNNREQVIKEKQAVHEANEAAIQAYSAEMQEQGRRDRGIYEKMQQGVASQDEINQYYHNVNHKYKDNIQQDRTI